MTVNRPRNWPDGYASNTPSSASSFGFDVAAELSRMNHPTNWTKPTDALALDRPVAYSTSNSGVGSSYEMSDPYLVRADLRALPQEQEVGAPSADRRRHDDRSRPTAAAVGAASSTPAGARRGLIALALCFAVGFVVGRRR